MSSTSFEIPDILINRPNGPAYTYRAVVRSIYDGDSIRVDIDLGFGVILKGDDGKGVPLRLYGIDTPEIKGVERPEGMIARDAVWTACPPTSDIILQTLKDTSGKFGRILAIIWTPHIPVSLNAWLLQEGMAEPFMLK